MTTDLTLQQQMDKINNAFYGKYVPQGILDNILAHFNDKSDAAEILADIVAILDRNVIHGVLSYLDNQDDKLAFLEIIRDQYNTPHPVEWAKLKFETAEAVIKESVERPLLALHSALRDE